MKRRQSDHYLFRKVVRFEMPLGKNMSSQRNGRKRGYRLIKSVFDFLFSLVFSVILLIPMLIIAVVIVIKEPGNPLFIQQRIGLGGKPFKIYKFRTMVKNADRVIEMLDRESYARYLDEFKLEEDPRLLGYVPGKKNCLGKMLRTTSLDEIPQVFFNVLLHHDMSVVGPRPILKSEMEKNYTLEEQKKLVSVKPGITGYWQAYARNSATYVSGRRQKMELYYVTHCSVLFDLKIMFATIGAVISKRGAH